MNDEMPDKICTLLKGGIIVGDRVLSVEEVCEKVNELWDHLISLRESKKLSRRRRTKNDISEQ